jgi:molybdate transport system ATP-binding protein
MIAETGLEARLDVRLGKFHLDASLAVPAGLTVLFGPSGAGKSLTLQAIAGLVPLTNGSVTLAGRTLADTAHGRALPARERRIGYVPQHYALFPHLSVAENVGFGLPQTSAPWDQSGRKERAVRIAELLTLVRLDGYEARRPQQLSGGQAQRVALARALAARPEALLLDEPLGALDAPTRAAVQDDLRRVVIESGVPAIVVTHDLAEARTLGDRMVVLASGVVVATGTVREVLASPPTSEAALLLGWRNVLPVRSVVRTGANVVVDLACGQTLAVVNGLAALAAGERAALALHGDRLALLSSAQVDNASSDEAILRGRIAAVADQGAHYVVTVKLDVAGTAQQVAVTCSPREWAVLAGTVGEPVAVRVPHDAARLVRDTGGHEEERQAAQ